MPLQPAPRKTDSDTAVWQAEGCSVTVEYSRQVLEELRQAAEEGFQKIPHGGIEVGALLLGSHDGNVARVREWRPIECEHARGPGFVLSEKDLQALDALIDGCSRAAELRGLEPVGWFHTHTRSKIFLSPEDQAVHDRFFQEPWQLALVMRLSKDSPASAGFFTRGAGDWNPQTSPREFTVMPDPSALSGATRMTAARKTPLHRRDMRVIRPGEAPPPVDAKAAPTPVPAVEARPQPALRPMAPEPVREPDPATPDFLVQDPVEPPPIWKRWPFLALAGLLLAVVGWFALSGTGGQRTSDATALRLQDLGGQIVISWNRDSRRVTDATRGVLEIVDGGSKRAVELNEDDIRRGTVTYARRAAEVEVSLEVYKGQSMVAREVARFVGQPVAADPPLPPGRAASGEIQRLKEGSDRINELLEAERKRAEELDKTLGETEAQLKLESPQAAGARRRKR